MDVENLVNKGFQTLKFKSHLETDHNKTEKWKIWVASNKSSFKRHCANFQ